MEFRVNRREIGRRQKSRQGILRKGVDSTARVWNAGRQRTGQPDVCITRAHTRTQAYTRARASELHDTSVYAASFPPSNVYFSRRGKLRRPS